MTPIIGSSPKFRAVMEMAKRVSKSKANIFIFGESGTGKEVLARFIHESGPHSQSPFVAINCSAIPETLLESELFGHTKGAFTGAIQSKLGLFEEAEDGTLFLDEIGDLSLSLQAKLLRVLQEKKIKRLGENQFRDIHCRIISATHKDLWNEVANETFREDLFYRLNVIPIGIPPLRDRPEDILPLAESFLLHHSHENNSLAKSFTKNAIQVLIENPWRGNVRELENLIERAVVLSPSEQIDSDQLLILQDSVSGDGPIYTNSSKSTKTFRVNCGCGLPKLEDVMSQFIQFAVDLNEGARDRTARQLGIDRKTLYKRLRNNHPQAVH